MWMLIRCVGSVDWIHIMIRLGCTLDGKQLGAVKR
jgi:hypothetical protein